MNIQCDGNATASISGVKIDKKLESTYYANVMFNRDGRKEAYGFSLAVVTKHSVGKGCFCSRLSYLNVVLCTKPYYAWQGEKSAIWLLFFWLFTAVSFEFCQP